MSFLNSRVAAAGAIAGALDKMLARHRGHSLQVFHTEYYGIIHHAVDH